MVSSEDVVSMTIPQQIYRLIQYITTSVPLIFPIQRIYKVSNCDWYSFTYVGWNISTKMEMFVILLNALQFTKTLSMQLQVV